MVSVSLRVTTEEVAPAVSTDKGLQSDLHSTEMSNVVLSADLAFA